MRRWLYIRGFAMVHGDHCKKYKRMWNMMLYALPLPSRHEIRMVHTHPPSCIVRLYSPPPRARYDTIPRLLIVPLMRAFDALVKHAHRLVRATYLHLHEVSLDGTAILRANRHGPVHVRPGVAAAEDVVHLLPIRRMSLPHLRRVYRLRVRTRRAGEQFLRGGEGGGGVGRDYLKEGAVQWTEPHDYGVVLLLSVQRGRREVRPLIVSRGGKKEKRRGSVKGF